MGRIVADRFGLEYSDLLQCAGEARQHVTDTALGQRVGVEGTPAILIRYGSDQPLTWISLNGQQYTRGGISYNVLAEVIERAQPAVSG
jgi:hypothetical protein